MAKIHFYQQLNLKNKLSKQEQRQNRGYRERFEGCQTEMSEEARGLRSTNRWLQNSGGDVKCSIGNGAKN